MSASPGYHLDQILWFAKSTGERMSVRENFSSAVVVALRDRVNGFCSNPACGCGTTAPNAEPGRATRIGVAAHIAAASPRGPRYNEDLTIAERSGPENGIWLCQNCARKIDVNWKEYDVDLLLSWKLLAENRAAAWIGVPRSGDAELIPVNREECSGGYLCPHCGTEFLRGHTVCIGCHGQIVEGSTKEERRSALFVGSAFAGFPLLWIVNQLGIKLFVPDSGVLGILPIFFVATLALFGGMVAISIADKLRRRHNPRVFVRALV